MDKLIRKIEHLHENEINHIKININQKQETVFISDESRIEVILNNLISNAIKYSDPNEKNPTVDVDIVINEKQVEIKVKDNGIGINPAFLKDIFKLFFRANDKRNVEGTGIGLYIVKETIEKLNGKIYAIANSTKGTTFDVIIPNHSLS
ncbi:MAG: sensor histidine kinase [Sphingobacteriaceae bacterium]|nr:sensor histidine kinase [Sphingobacteriaceae bacterium]